MKRKTKIFTTLILSTCFLFLLTGCQKFDSVKESFESNGYAYSKIVSDVVEALLKEFEDEDIVVKPHLFSKGINLAIVLEFSTSRELRKQIKNNETLKSFYEDLSKSDYIRGNCLLIPSLGTIGSKSEIISIFKGQKVSD